MVDTYVDSHHTTTLAQSSGPFPPPATHVPQQAIHGLSPEQSKQGFVLTCQSHPVGPGLEIELGMYDVVYETQYGQYERKGSEEGKKKKGMNIFG